MSSPPDCADLNLNAASSRLDSDLASASAQPSETTTPNMDLQAPNIPQIFARAHHVHVDGANVFSNAAGNIFHITLLGAANGPVATGELDLESSSPGILTQTSSMQAPSSSTARQDVSATFRIPVTALSSPSHTVPQPSKAQNASELYTQLLYPKGHGYPLFDPQPGSNLPVEYQEKGIGIGDVGLISTEGKFDFLFNVCLPADHPINGGLVPDGFRPICIDESREVDIRPRGLRSGSYIANDSVRATSPSSASQFDGSYTFECPCAKGAILALPEGASRANLLSLGKLFQYAEKNAVHWYRFANRAKARQAVNGSLYLVTGHDKAGAWGTASFSGMGGCGTFDLRFSSTQSPLRLEPSPAYIWSGPSLATTHEGPAFHPTDDRREHCQNQCVFLRGYRIALGQTFWNLLFQTVDVTDIKEQKTAKLFKRSTFVPFGSNKTMLGKLLSIFLSREPPIPMSNDSHPSNTINRYLVEQCPGNNVAITHDDIWCSVVADGELTIPEPSALIKRLHDNYVLECQDGTSTFSKPKLASVPAANASPGWTTRNYERRCLSSEFPKNTYCPIRPEMRHGSINW